MSRNYLHATLDTLLENEFDDYTEIVPVKRRRKTDKSHNMRVISKQKTIKRRNARRNKKRLQEIS